MPEMYVRISWEGPYDDEELNKAWLCPENLRLALMTTLPMDVKVEEMLISSNGNELTQKLDDSWKRLEKSHYDGQMTIAKGIYECFVATGKKMPPFEEFNLHPDNIGKKHDS